MNRSDSLKTLMLEFCASAFRSRSTLEQYQVSVDLLIRWNPDFSLADFTEENISAFLRWYAGRGVSPNTVRRKRRHIITIWRFAADRGYLPEPKARAIQQPREQKRVATTWTTQELSQIVSACHRAKRPNSRRWNGCHWEALIRVLYDTGHRIGAVMSTSLSGLNTRRGELTVSAESSKTGVEQIHTLQAETLRAIEKMNNPRRSMLFDWPRSPKYLQKCFRRIVEDAGLPSSRRDLFHKIRRTSYTEVYIALGLDAASWHAGHSTDMSDRYLDKSRLTTVNAVAVLSRF